MVGGHWSRTHPALSHGAVVSQALNPSLGCARAVGTELRADLESNTLANLQISAALSRPDTAVLL